MGRYRNQPGWIAATLLVACLLGRQAPAQQPLVEKFKLHDTIQPVSQGELEKAIARANGDGAQALLVEMDTPGGMIEPMRAMVAAVLAARVPVIMYVAPSG